MYLYTQISTYLSYLPTWMAKASSSKSSKGAEPAQSLNRAGPMRSTHSCNACVQVCMHVVLVISMYACMYVCKDGWMDGFM